MFKLCIFVLCILFSLCTKIEGLQCYTCTYVLGNQDDSCVTNPEKVSTGQAIVKCNKKYCTTLRQEFKDPPEKIASFFRGCEENPPMMNTQIEDPNFITYFRACTDDLCNGGTGKDSSEGNIGGISDGEGTLLVPGKRSGAPNLINSFIIISLVASCVMVL